MQVMGKMADVCSPAHAGGEVHVHSGGLGWVVCMYTCLWHAYGQDCEVWMSTHCTHICVVVGEGGGYWTAQ